MISFLRIVSTDSELNVISEKATRRIGRALHSFQARSTKETRRQSAQAA
jgi:hypothetical protein